MAKNYTLTDIIDLYGQILFNYEVISGNGSSQYYIIRLEWHGKAINGGASKTSMVFLNDGSPQTTKFSPKQIYQRLKLLFANAVGDSLKGLYIDLIDNDIGETE
ncbi:MAG TPA: hypothetical protein VMV77_09295 [Bacteroidales bacterium]|nr:hypothetical protein [Bacteroidales bacterium]